MALAEARFRTCVGITLMLGIVLRLLLIEVTTSPSDPLNRLYPGFTDGTVYFNIARSLVEQGVYGYGGRVSAFRPPAYPFLIALFLKIFGDSLTPVRVAQVVLFVIMALGYVHVAARSFGKPAAVVVALLTSVYPLFVFITTEIATESLYMALEALIFALVLHLLRRREPRADGPTALALGLCCGAGILTRPNMLLVGVVALAAMAWQRARRGERPRVWMVVPLATLAGTLTMLSPWLMRNWSQLGAPVITTNLEYNLFRGTFDLIDGIPNNQNIAVVFRDNDVLYEKDIEDPARGRLPISEIENERNAHAAALRMIRTSPAGWLKERMRNALYLWLNLEWEPQLTHGRPIIVAAAVAVSVIYYLVLVGALAGGALAWRTFPHEDGRICLRLAWLFILAALPVAVTFVGKRYRVAMIDPYLILVASAGFVAWLKGGRWSGASDGPRIPGVAERTPAKPGLNELTSAPRPPRRPLLGRSGNRCCFEARGDRPAHSFDQLVLRGARIGGRVDRRVHGHVDRPRPDPEAPLRQDARPSLDRHGDDCDAGLEGQDEAALLEGQEPSVRAPRPLREDDDRGAAPDFPGRPAQAADGALAIGAIDEDEPRKPERPPEDRDEEQLALGHHPETGGHRQSQRRDVEQALMIRYVHAGA